MYAHRINHRYKSFMVKGYAYKLPKFARLYAIAGQMKKYALNLHTSSCAFIFIRVREGRVHLPKCSTARSCIHTAWVEKHASTGSSAINNYTCCQRGGGGQLGEWGFVYLPTCHAAQAGLCGGCLGPACRVEASRTHLQNPPTAARRLHLYSAHQQPVQTAHHVHCDHPHIAFVKQPLRSLHATMHALEVQPKARSICAHSL